jgi:nucleotide-binding universal stress UspA family protein
MSAIRRILVPTDFSETGRAAFELACSLVAGQGAEVLLLYVHPPAPAFDEAGALVPETPEYREQLRERLRRLCPPDPAVRVDYWLDKGDPAAAILRLAALMNCDLIVMGTHGRTGIFRLLLGSVTEAVLRKAPCPVLTVNRVSAEGRKPVPGPAGRAVQAAG